MIANPLWIRTQLFAFIKNTSRTLAYRTLLSESANYRAKKSRRKPQLGFDNRVGCSGIEPPLIRRQWLAPRTY